LKAPLVHSKGLVCRLQSNKAHIYKDDIIEFVKRDVADKSKKMSAAAMREDLQRRHKNKNKNSY